MFAYNYIKDVLEPDCARFPDAAIGSSHQTKFEQHRERLTQLKDVMDQKNKKDSSLTEEQCAVACGTIKLVWMLTRRTKWLSPSPWSSTRST